MTLGFSPGKVFPGGVENPVESSCSKKIREFNEIKGALTLVSVKKSWLFTVKNVEIVEYFTVKNGLHQFRKDKVLKLSKIVFLACMFTGANAFAQVAPKEEAVKSEKKIAKASGKSETPDADPKAKKETADTQKASDQAGAENAVGKEGGDKEGALGPGGKPLRMDYPGTEESKTSVMSTSQIKGLETVKAGDTAYGLRVKELETKIDDLKEKVFQSKTKIVLLHEKLLSGNLAGSKAVIVHKTELGSAWRLTKAIYNLDGTRVFALKDTRDGLAEEDVFEVYNGGLSPGNHKVTVFLKYEGTSLGIFPYFKGYGGDMRFVCDITAKQGKISRVEVSIFPKGGIAESIEKRPDVRCHITYIDNVMKDEKATHKSPKSAEK